MAMAASHQMARDGAHRRYPSSLRALAAVQRFGPLTAVQVNFNLDRMVAAGEEGRPDVEVPS